MLQKPTDLDAIIKEAVDFHGHLGPFLAVGIRMGLIGLRELETTRGNSKLQVTAKLQQTVPFSCAIDGIQLTTQCTVGNGKLKLQNEPNTISATFKLGREKQATVTLKPSKYKALKKTLPKDRQSYKTIQLARKIASAAEQELFTVKKK